MRGTYVLLVLDSFSTKDGWEDRLGLSSMVVDEDGRFVVLATLEKVGTCDRILGAKKEGNSKGPKEKGNNKN